MVTTIEYEPTLEEFRESLALYLNPRRRWANLPALGMILGGSVAMLNHSPSDPNFIFWLGVYLVVYGLLVLPLRKWSFRKRTAKIFKDAAPSRRPQVTTFDDDGVAAADSLSHSKTRWPAYSHFVETPKMFVLFQGPAVPIAVPKRALASPEDEAQLRSLLQQHIGRSTYERVQGFQVLPVPSTPAWYKQSLGG